MHTVGPLQQDPDGRSFRMIAGRKVYQIIENTARDRELNDVINTYRAAGMDLPGFALRKIKNMKNNEQSLGTRRVRPAYRELSDQERALVEDVKTQTARLIDLLEDLRVHVFDNRSVSYAQTRYEEGCLWAVKAITGPAATE